MRSGVGPLGVLLVLVLVLASACAGSTSGDGGAPGAEPPTEGMGDCGDDDPLTNAGWAGFCADRVDDNCAVDVGDDCPEITSSSTAGEHHFACTHDEPCPATAPGAAPPSWDCEGPPPANVVAYALYDDAANAQVRRFCAFVYESPVVADEFYAAIDVVSGPDPQGPVDPAIGSGGLCSYDFNARRYLFFTDLDEGECAPVRFTHAYGFENGGIDFPVDQQQLSTPCRKAIRLVTRDDPAFSPDIQFFAASEDELTQKLALLETAEIACVGIDNTSGAPYRATEVFVVQAEQTITLVPR